MQKFPMTKNGAKLLEEELARLKGPERSSVIQAIAEARAHGDISENAEYDAAKEKQAFDEISYQIVGDDEADVKQGKISVNTPVARSLIGKHSGDVVTVKVPSGTKEYEIIDIRLV